MALGGEGSLPYGIMVFGLFMFGFDGDDTSVFDETVQFNIAANYDACAYSVLTPPYPGTLTLWYENEEGRTHRVVRLDEIRPGPCRLPPGGNVAG